METIREYLNNLFMSMPETPEVLRAKAELLEMMEDKYEELLRDGKTEKEAVGIVISEFGNLEELASELGIELYMKKDSEEGETGSRNDKKRGGMNKKKTVYRVGFEEARAYISYAWKHAKLIAIGVMLCIWSPFLDSILYGASAEGYMPEVVADMTGTIVLFVMVALAVALFCSASGMKKKYGNLSRYCVILDEKAGSFLGQKKEKDEKVRLKLRITGVALCILSALPSSVNVARNEFVSEILDSSVLLIVGVGVLLLILSASVGNRYSEMEKAIENAEQQGEATEFATASWRETKKKSMPAMIVVGFVLLGVAIVGISVFSNVMYFLNRGTSVEESLAIENTYDIGEAAKLVLNLDASNVRIERGGETEMGDNQLVVKYNGDSKRKPVVENKGDRIEICEKGNGHWFSFDINFFNTRTWTSEVTIIVPANRTDLNYDVDVDAGNISMEGLWGTGAVLDVDAGEVILENCTFHDKVVLDVDAGNAEVLHSMIGSIEGDVDAGNFRCLLTDTHLENYSMDLEVSAGNITVNGENCGTHYKQTAQAVQGGDSKPSRIQLEVDLGDIEVEAPIEKIETQ